MITKSLNYIEVCRMRILEIETGRDAIKFESMAELKPLSSIMKACGIGEYVCILRIQWTLLKEELMAGGMIFLDCGWVAI